MKVAITGHQNLGDSSSVEWLKSQVEQEITKLHPELGYSCLAVGADQLFVQVLIKYDIPFIAIIPCNKYEETFDPKSITLYKSPLAQASSIIHLEHLQPSEEAFFDASKLMVNNCDLLISIWNGLPAKGLGGTADVISYARELDKNIIHLNPIDKTIKQF